jgi:hypothetical protein
LKLSTAIILCATALILGSGGLALNWLRWKITDHNFDRQVSQEERRAEAVQALPLPKEPIGIVIKNKPRFCIQIERAEIDGDRIVVYAKNVCQSDADYFEIHWKPKAPDGTVLKGNYQNWTKGKIEAGERFEFIHRFDADPRAVVVELSVRGI